MTSKKSLRHELEIASTKVASMEILLNDASSLLDAAEFPFTGDMPNGTGIDYESSRDSWQREYHRFMEQQS